MKLFLWYPKVTRKVVALEMCTADNFKKVICFLLVQKTLKYILTAQWTNSSSSMNNFNQIFLRWYIYRAFRSSSWNKPCIVDSSFFIHQNTNLAEDHPIKFINSYLSKGNNTLVKIAFMRSDQWLQREYFGNSSSPHRVKPDYKIGIDGFSAKQAALRRKSKDWLPRNQDNVSEWGDMSIPDCCFSEFAL